MPLPHSNIPFTKPYLSGEEGGFLQLAINQENLSGDGPLGQQVERILQEITLAQRVLVTPSCTAALELATLLLDIRPGDEVILPSFTYVSVANAFVLRGASLVFADVDPATMNLDPECVQEAITSKTRAIGLMHYGGVSCPMDDFRFLAEAYNLALVEDAAHGIGARWGNHPLGSMGHFGAISFHDTKNIQCGEGGALLLNDENFIERALVLRDKGTNRQAFRQGKVDQYSWVDTGSSFLLGELPAAFLLGQLSQVEAITTRRRRIWNLYREGLEPLRQRGLLEFQEIPEQAFHNGHLFYVKCADEARRDELIHFLEARGVDARFHYIPLHSSTAGVKYGRFCGEDRFTTADSARLLRLPLFYQLREEEVARVCSLVTDFFSRL